MNRTADKNTIKLTLDSEAKVIIPPQLDSKLSNPDWRQFVELPLISSEQIQNAKSLVKLLEKDHEGLDKFKSEKSLPCLIKLCIATSSGSKIQNQNNIDPELLAVVIYELRAKPELDSSTRSLMKNILDLASQDDSWALKTRACLLRYGFQLDANNRKPTVADLEKLEDAFIFCAKHRFEDLLDRPSPREIISLAYPTKDQEGKNLIRLELLSAEKVPNERLIRSAEILEKVSDLLLETASLKTSESGMTCFPEVIKKTKWGILLKDRGLHRIIGSHPLYQGNNLLVLDLAAQRLNIPNLFGASEGQVPPFYITRIGLWKAHYKGHPMAWYLGQSLIAAVKKESPDLCYSDSTRAGKLNPSKCTNVKWFAHVKTLAEASLYGQGISIIDLIKYGDPEFFGYNKDQIIPVEIGFIGVKSKADMRARIAIGLYRAGLGTLASHAKQTYWELNLKDYKSWLNSIPATFGQDFIEPLRGSLRKFGAESVSRALCLLVNNKPSVPNEIEKLDRHALFTGTLELLLNSQKDMKVRVNLGFYSANLPHLTESVAATPTPKATLQSKTTSSLAVTTSNSPTIRRAGEVTKSNISAYARSLIQKASNADKSLSTEVNLSKSESSPKTIKPQVTMSTSVKEPSGIIKDITPTQENILMISAEDTYASYAALVALKNKWPTKSELLEYIAKQNKHSGPLNIDESELGNSPFRSI